MLKRAQVFLGPTMSRVFVAWFAITGLASLILNVVVNQYDWVRPVQSLIVIVFLVGVVIIVMIRLAPEERRRWLAILVPALIALFIGLLIVPQLSGLFLGLAVGWMIAGTLISRGRGPMEYRAAIKHLRKNQYTDAIRVMDGLIRADPDQPNHYRFRAEVYRLWGKLKQATKDYQKMTQLAPDSAQAFNGLAEVHLQAGEYQEAWQAAERANQLAPDDWVTYYNLGMIEDRLRESKLAVEHLNQALGLKVKDARHRVLIHLYLARAYGRMGDSSQAKSQVQALRKLQNGLDEWETILKSDQAATLRDVIGDDVQTAQELVNGELSAEDLSRA